MLVLYLIGFLLLVVLDVVMRGWVVLLLVLVSCVYFLSCGFVLFAIC